MKTVEELGEPDLELRGDMFWFGPMLWKLSQYKHPRPLYVSDGVLHPYEDAESSEFIPEVIEAYEHYLAFQVFESVIFK